MNLAIAHFPMRSFVDRLPRLSQRVFYPSLLIAALLCSALGLLYCKDLNRCLFIESQALQQTQMRLQTNWKRLLLEHGLLSNQQRVQAYAQSRLGMHVPTSQAIVVIR